MTLSFTQPSCVACWNDRNPGRQAHAIRAEYAEDETCCFCGEQTRSGIYVRVDPATVDFPTLTK